MFIAFTELDDDTVLINPLHISGVREAYNEGYEKKVDWRNIYVMGSEVPFQVIQTMEEIEETIRLYGK